jgi:hypothetical protein
MRVVGSYWNGDVLAICARGIADADGDARKTELGCVIRCVRRELEGETTGADVTKPNPVVVLPLWRQEGVCSAERVDRSVCSHGIIYRVVVVYYQFDPNP